MAEIAEKVFDNSTKVFTGTIQLIDKFLEQLGKALDDNAKDAPQKALAKWIKQGKGIAQYAVQGKCIGEMKFEMKRNGIAYVECVDDVLIVKENDLDRVRELNHDILLARTNYFQEADLRDFEDAIANNTRQKNKDVLTLHGLDKYTLRTIKNKSNDISKGFTVAHECTQETKDGGIHDACISTSRVISFKLENEDSDRFKKDFCRATVEAMLSLYGPNAENKRQRLEDDERFEKKVAELKGSKENRYIVGARDNTKYIDIDREGFTFYDTARKGNTVVSKFKNDDINYDGELQVAMDCIFDKSILYNPDDLVKYLSGEKKEISPERTAKDKVQLNRSMAERSFALKIDKMVKDKMVLNGILNKDGKGYTKPVDTIYSDYCKEASKIMTALNEGRTVEGYKTQDFEYMDKVAKRFHVEFKDYTLAAQKMTEYNHEVHKARPYRAKDRVMVTQRQPESR